MGIEGGSYIDQLCNTAFCGEDTQTSEPQGLPTHKVTDSGKKAISVGLLGKVSISLLDNLRKDRFRLDLYIPPYPFFLIPFWVLLMPIPHPGIYPVLTLRLWDPFFISAAYPLRLELGALLTDP